MLDTVPHRIQKLAYFVMSRLVDMSTVLLCTKLGLSVQDWAFYIVFEGSYAETVQFYILLFESWYSTQILGMTYRLQRITLSNYLIVYI